MRGQLFHNFMANEVKVTLAKFFDQVQLEYRVRRNGIATDLDLFASSGSRTLAIEVETTQRHAIDNARKAGAVNVPTWIIVPTRSLQSRLLGRLEALDLRPGGELICVLLLGQLEQALTHYLSWRIKKKIQNKQFSNPRIGTHLGRSQ